MKTLSLKFKTILLFLLVGIAFTGCRDGKEADASSNQMESNQEQVDNTDATIPESTPESNTSITEENLTTSPESPEGNEAPVTLDCNYFQKNPNTVLKDNPNAKIDYIIPCMARVEGKLAIEPGVVIAFEQGAGMDFKGSSSFTMQGTAEKPIILTGKEPIKGYWKGIYTVSSSPNNKMKYVTVDYAGGSGSIAALRLYREHSVLSLENCTFSNSKTSGAAIKDNVGKDIQNVTITNCTFTKNGIPLDTQATRLRMFDGTNSFVGNEMDYIKLDGGKLYGDATWAKLNVPYFLQGNFTFSDGVLTVAPGTEIIMSSQTWLHLSNKASLKMVGTAAKPITVRGEHDVPGFWLQLNIDSSSPLNEIGHVIFQNAGRTTKKPNGAIFLGSSKFLNIHDVTFKNCYEYGISLRDESNSHLEHANLKLDNTPKLFSDYSGKELDLSENKKS